MDALQRRAWVELVLMVANMAIGAAGLVLMVHLNTKGIAYVIVSVVVGTVTFLFVYLHNMKIAARYDEREKSILRRAVTLGAFAFTTVVACTSFAAFFVVGGGGSIPVYVMPATLLGALFAAQFVQSAAILIQFAREQADE